MKEFVVTRKGHVVSVSFLELTEKEIDDVLDGKSTAFLKRLCKQLWQECNDLEVAK